MTIPARGELRNIVRHEFAVVEMRGSQLQGTLFIGQIDTFSHTTELDPFIKKLYGKRILPKNKPGMTRCES